MSAIFRTRFALLTAAVVLTLIVGFAVLPAAQITEAQEGGEMIRCDSTTILLLYIAEYNYGFHSMMDVSVFEKGQYAPLFDAMMTSMQEGAMMDEGEMMQDPEDTMMGEGEMMEEGEMMDADMIALQPAVIANEPAECTALRVEVETFLYDVLSAEIMMMEGEG